MKVARANALLCSLLWLAVPALSALAADGSDAYYREALSAEKEQDYASVLALCAAAVAEAPQSAPAQRCQRKTAALERRRDGDGTFSNWSQLEAVRAAFQTMDRELRERRVAAIWRSKTASDAVRIEAALWLAKDRLDAGEPVAAFGYTEPLLGRSVEQEPALTARLRQQHAVILAALGRNEEALALQDEVRIPAPKSAERPTPVDLVILERRYLIASRAAAVMLLLFVLPASAVVLARLRRRTLSLAGFVPLGLGPIALATLGAYGLAELWERGAGRALPLMGIGFASLHLLSALALRAARGSALGLALLRTGAALATLSVAWLSLWSTDTIDWVLR